MPNSGAEGQRKNSAMEDSTAMTIEFLRARLLSERSVSRTARQRADQLAKRVMELEEQLKIVSIQRKKAEKAAAEVLAILESQGISDFSETLDSCSDQDGVLCESKESNNSTKDDERSTTSKLRSEVEDGLSGSELEASSINGKTLSWKGNCNYAPNSFERRNFPQARRRHSNFTSTGSSSKHRLGKSCRQIRRERRAAAADVRDASLQVDAQGSEVATGPGNISSHSENRTEVSNTCTKREEGSEVSGNPLSFTAEDQVQGSIGCLQINGDNRDGEMERALLQQAQLIDQYKAEENAQREWEEKFRENNNYALDSCEPGNQSDITDEKNESQTNEDTGPVDKIPAYDVSAKLNTNEAHTLEMATTRTSNGPVLTDPTIHAQNIVHADMVNLPGHQHRRIEANEFETGFQEVAFPGLEYPNARIKGKQPDSGILGDSKFQSLPDGFPGYVSANKPSFLGDGNFLEGEWSESQSRLHGTLHQRANTLGGVLEALKSAKLSLQHELTHPLGEGAIVAVPDAQARAIKSVDSMDIPLGCAGLFRLPSESESYSSANLSTRYSNFALARHSSDVGFGTSSYQYATYPSMEHSYRISAARPYLEPSLDSRLGIRAPTRYSYPQLRSPMAGVPSHGGHSSAYLDARTRRPTEDGYSFMTRGLD